MANKIQKNKWKIDSRSNWAVIYKSLNPVENEWDRRAWKTLGGYRKTHQSSKLSLLKGLVIEFGGRPLREILNVEPIDYQRRVHTKCVCGANLSDRLYRMRIRENSGKEGIEHHVHGKIKAGELLSQMGRSSKTEFVVGKDCYAFLPEMLSELGYETLMEVCDVKRSRNGRKKDLENIIEIPTELKTEFNELGIDAKSVRRMGMIAGRTGMTMQGLLYELDPGRKNSFANWFRERIKNGVLGNDEIVGIYEKLEDAPYLVSKNELAKLATYSYEFRRFDSDALIGIEKDDLLYLNGLNGDDEFVKEFGKPNIDKHYVRPATKFRSRNVVENVTIRQKMEQSHITFLEALGVKLHFPKLEKIRKIANRKTSDKYGIGIEWNYLLKEIKPLFEKEKRGLHEEYLKFGEIVRDHVLTKNEYFAVKDFLERGSLGSKTERENYLRMFSIGKFREIAPRITAIGRKLRMARREYERSNNEWAWRDLIKQDYVLREDFGESQKTIEMLSDGKIFGIRNKNLLKFQQIHGNLIGNMYENGLIAKKYISDLKGENAFSRYAKLLEKEGVGEMDRGLSERIENISNYVHTGLICVDGHNYLNDISRKFIAKNGEWRVKMDCMGVESLIKSSGLDISRSDEIMREINQLNSIGPAYYLSEGNQVFVSTNAINPENKSRTGIFSAYNFPMVRENLHNLKNSVEVGRDFARKIIEIDEASAILGVKTSYIQLLGDKELRGKKIFAEKSFANRVEELYGRLRTMERNRMFDRY